MNLSKHFDYLDYPIQDMNGRFQANKKLKKVFVIKNELRYLYT
jgi:hypothetical protein